MGSCMCFRRLIEKSSHPVKSLFVRTKTQWALSPPTGSTSCILQEFLTIFVSVIIESVL